MRTGEKAVAGIFRRDLTVYGTNVEMKLAPGRTIEGDVLDGVSKSPVTGAKVTGMPTGQLEYPGYDRFYSATDERGHYRIDGLPITSKARLVVDVPSESPYFRRSTNLEIKPGPGPLRVEFPLAKGVWITGRVVDDATGEGLPNESIEYHTFIDNPYLQKDLEAGLSPQVGRDVFKPYTVAGGTFRIRGYPGRGIVSAGSRQDYLEGIGADSIKGLMQDEYTTSLYENTDDFNPYPPLNPHLHNTTIELNIPINANSFECEVRLKKKGVQ